MSLWLGHMWLLPAVALLFLIPFLLFVAPLFLSWASPLVSRVKSPCSTWIVTRDGKRRATKQTEKGKEIKRTRENPSPTLWLAHVTRIHHRTQTTRQHECKGRGKKVDGRNKTTTRWSTVNPETARPLRNHHRHNATIKYGRKRNESACTHIQVHPSTSINKGGIWITTQHAYAAQVLSAILLLFNLKSHSSVNATQTARRWRGYSPTFSFRSFVLFVGRDGPFPSLAFSCSTVISSLLRIIETVQIRGSLLLPLTLLISGWDVHFNWVRLNHEGKKLKIFTRQFDYRSRYRISW